MEWGEIPTQLRPSEFHRLRLDLTNEESVDWLGASTWLDRAVGCQLQCCCGPRPLANGGWVGTRAPLTAHTARLARAAGKADATRRDPRGRTWVQPGERSAQAQKRLGSGLTVAQDERSTASAEDLPIRCVSEGWGQNLTPRSAEE
jgi:hypothetical protein